MLNWNSLLNGKRLGASQASDISKFRSEFQRDFDRIIFSSAFRRLQDKTQVFPMPVSDFVHSRLTHSIEVSSLGRTLGNLAGDFILGKEKDLANLGVTMNIFGDIVAAASLAHDVGNPPFGHSGEKAISDFFKKNSSLKSNLNESEWNDFINYEGNAHGFRLLTNHHPDEIEKGGLKLTYATLAAFSKYPRESYIPTNELENIGKRASLKKFGFFQTEKDFFLEVAKETNLLSLTDSKSKSISFSRNPLTFLMEAADNICYRIIDLEDGFKLNYLKFKEIEELLMPFMLKEKTSYARYLTLLDEGEKVGYLRAKAINSLVFETMDTFIQNYSKIMSADFDDELTNHIPSFGILEGPIKESNIYLYNRKAVIEIELAGYKIINGLLEIFMDANLSTTSYTKKLLQIVPNQFVAKEGDSHYLRMMRIVDFIARMSDSYAINLYGKLSGQKLPAIE